MKLFSFLKTAFHVYLYKGSHTDTKIYKGLINYIEKNTNKTCQVIPYNFFKRNKFPKDAIIIGHSFGGYFSLLDYYANKDNIKGIVLLNSHFNSMGKAWYPKIQQCEIEIPVLTILGGRDTRLPLTTSLWDYYEKKENSLHDKFYLIEKDREHFTGIEEIETLESDKLGIIISDFIQNIQESNFSKTRHNLKTTEENYTYNFFGVLDKTINYSWSINLYDGIAKIIMGPEYWSFIHFCLFLFFKPIHHTNAQFHDTNSLFFKTSFVTPEQMIKEFEKQLPRKLKPEKIILPTIHPSVPVWLSWKPKVTNTSYQVLILPINNETVYYKFPNPYIILSKL